MELEVMDTYTYLRSTMFSTLLLDAKISFRIVKAAVVMTKLNKQVWKNNLLTMCLQTLRPVDLIRQ